jgi:hypothetical protein
MEVCGLGRGKYAMPRKEAAAETDRPRSRAVATTAKRLSGVASDARESGHGEPEGPGTLDGRDGRKSRDHAVQATVVHPHPRSAVA